MVDEQANMNVDMRRNFIGPDGKTTYYITAPSADDIRGADWNYSKVYTKSIVEGITTSAEMTDILRRRGIIGPEFEQRAAELTQTLNDKIRSLSGTNTIDEKRILAFEISNAREELFQWNQRLGGPMNNTCEQMADDARLEFLTSCMIVDRDNNRVWDSYDTFRREKNQALALKCRFEVMLYLQGLDSDFLEQTPEARIKREIDEEVSLKASEAVMIAKALLAETEAENEVVTEIEADTALTDETLIDAESETKTDKKTKSKPSKSK
jgi:hypothetical protein